MHPASNLPKYVRIHSPTSLPGYLAHKQIFYIIIPWMGLTLIHSRHRQDREETCPLAALQPAPSRPQPVTSPPIRLHVLTLAVPQLAMAGMEAMGAAVAPQAPRAYVPFFEGGCQSLSRVPQYVFCLDHDLIIVQSWPNIRSHSDVTLS